MQTVFEMVECGNFKFSTLRTLCIHFSSPRRKELRRRRNGINIVFGERAENTNFSNVLNLTTSLLAFGSVGGGWSSTKYIYLHNWNWTHNKVFKFLISNREIEKREYNLSEIYSNSRFDSNLFYGIMWKKGKLCVLRKIPAFPFYSSVLVAHTGSVCLRQGRRIENWNWNSFILVVREGEREDIHKNLCMVKSKECFFCSRRKQTKLSIEYFHKVVSHTPKHHN